MVSLTLWLNFNRQVYSHSDQLAEQAAEWTAASEEAFGVFGEPCTYLFNTRTQGGMLLLIILQLIFFFFNSFQFCVFEHPPVDLNWFSSFFAPVTKCCIDFLGPLPSSDRRTFPPCWITGRCLSYWTASRTNSQELHVSLTWLSSWILSVWLLQLSKYCMCTCSFNTAYLVFKYERSAPTGLTSLCLFVVSHNAGLDSKYFERRPDSIPVYNPSSNPPSRGNTLLLTIILYCFHLWAAIYTQIFWIPV